MNQTIIEQYKEYSNKIGDRKSLYKTVAEEYGLQTAIYPGSHIDIAPSEIRELNGALFCDRRYNTVFVYHNGADSYYASRGFRGKLVV